MRNQWKSTNKESLRARDGPTYDNLIDMYDAANHAMSIRKSVLLTTTIAAVFWASDNNDINWIIDLDGWKAWGFLGLAHIYYVVSWTQWRGRLFIEPVNVEKQIDIELSDPDHRRGRWYLSHRLTVGHGDRLC